MNGRGHVCEGKGMRNCLLLAFWCLRFGRTDLWARGRASVRALVKWLSCWMAARRDARRSGFVGGGGEVVGENW